MNLWRQIEPFGKNQKICLCSLYYNDMPRFPFQKSPPKIEDRTPY